MMRASIQQSETGAIRVWEWPVRLFHWLLATSVVVAWFTRSDQLLHVHVFAGYVVAGLLVFRMFWGFVGGPYARFHAFRYTWRQVRAYLLHLFRGAASSYTGHNPAGSWAIFALLALIFLVVMTGLFTLGGEEQHGPLAGFVGINHGEIAHTLHELLAWALLGLVGLHLFGVAIESAVHRRNLVKAMITGYKIAPASAPSAPLHRPVGLVLISSLILGSLLYFKDALFSAAPYAPFTRPPLADNAVWRNECGGCHLAYHPSLLPARSWQKMMTAQNAHFGDDLALDERITEEITLFLLSNGAEKAHTEAAWKIDRSIPQSESPLRITETIYWKQKHNFDTSVWTTPEVKGRHDCAACHLDAKLGTFEDGAMRIPSQSIFSTLTWR